MGLKNYFIAPTFILILAIVFVLYDDYKSTQGLEKLEKWAEDNKVVLNEAEIKLEPFEVKFDQNEWNLLIKRLELTRYFEPLSEKYAAKNEFGFDPEYSKELVDYWKTNFSWSAQIDKINRLPQFRIKIDNEITIHFVRFITNKKSNLKPIPIMLLDGWPGHFFGFYKMINYIEANYKDLSFDIIVPSIPGFGYSTPLYKIIDYFDTATFFDAIMRYLHGENVNYYVHGEDWGSVITNTLAKLYPKRVKAIHITMPSYPKFTEPFFVTYLIMGQISQNLIHTQEELDAGFSFSLSSLFLLLMRKTGYFHIQATKPDTLGAALADSPVGLLAWILEKYQFGSFGEKSLGKKDGNLDVFNRDDYLSIVTYYWMTNTITSSCRLYKAYAYSAVSQWPKTEVSHYKTSEKVASAIQYFKHEVTNIPFNYLKRRFLNLKSFKIEKQGGHFAAWENPELTAKDFIKLVKSIL